MDHKFLVSSAGNRNFDGPDGALIITRGSEWNISNGVTITNVFRNSAADFRKLRKIVGNVCHSAADAGEAAEQPWIAIRIFQVEDADGIKDRASRLYSIEHILKLMPARIISTIADNDEAFLILLAQIQLMYGI